MNGFMRSAGKKSIEGKIETEINSQSEPLSLNIIDSNIDHWKPVFVNIID